MKRRCNLVQNVILFIMLMTFFTYASAYGQQQSHASTLKNEQFFTVDYPKSGSPISNPMKAGGKHNYKVSSHIWVLLFDGIGFYLQNPEVTLYDDGTWEHKNICPGSGIQSFIFVLVDDDGNKVFESMVKERKFGQFSTLPNNSKKISTVKVGS